MLKWTLIVTLVFSAACADDDNDPTNVEIDGGGQIDLGAPDAGDDAGDAGELDMADDGGTVEDHGFGPNATFDGFEIDPTLVVAPNADTPLVAEITFTTAEQTTATVELDVAGDVRTLEFSDEATEHTLLLVELTPDTAYGITLTASDADGAVATATGVFVTDPLPALAPALTAVISDPARMEPGLTLFNVPTDAGGALLVVNADAEIVWAHFTAARIQDNRQLDNGNFLFILSNRNEMREVSPRGDIVRRYVTSRRDPAPMQAIVVDADSFHHEAAQLANGDFLALSSTARDDIAGYPTSEDDLTPNTEAVTVVADVIVRFDESGNIVNEVNLFDVLDIGRIGYDSFGSYWNGFYSEFMETYDWTHANGVIIDPADDNYIVSMRHQDAVVKITPTGEVIWILGPPDNWVEPWASKVLTPQGPDFRHSYHTHAPEITSTGTLLLYDNNVYGASPTDPKVSPTYSRGVEYDIDEQAMTVTQVWEWDGEQDGLFCRIIGNADEMPTTGNVFLTFGSTAPDAEDVPNAHLIEVTRPAGEKVWELTVDDDNPEGPADRNVYRALRIPGLYAPGILQ